MIELKITNWAIHKLRTPMANDPYAAPEQRHYWCVSGHVENHPRLGDADVQTSAIQKVEGRKITTMNTIYILTGNPSESFQNFLNTLNMKADEYLAKMGTDE